MPRFPRPSPSLVVLALVGSVASPALLAAPASAQLSSSDLSPSCAQWEVSYATAGTLRVTETAMGAGNGTFPVGPGTLVLRVDTRTGRVKLMQLQLRERFSIHPTAMMWKATIVTDVAARALADDSGALALGTRLAQGVVQWAEPLKTYRSDGTLTCEGSLCGKFGAPPAGRSDLHEASRTVRLEPLRFDRDGQTFRMEAALVSSSETPRHRTYLALSGRRTAKSCIDPAPVELSTARPKPAASSASPP